MNLKISFLAIGLCFLFCACSSNTNKSAEDKPSPEVVQEIQTLDSLNQKIEETTQEIEKSIESVEAAISILDDL